MNRLALILASTLLLATSNAKAGELDAEFGGKATPPTPTAGPTVDTSSSSELDAESPDQACHRRYWNRRFYGYGYARGYYGYGFGYGRRFGYGRYGW
jgi:hypothetical protein